MRQTVGLREDDGNYKKNWTGKEQKRKE